MIFYEMKKILLKNSAKVALIFLGGVTLFMIHMAINGVWYVDESGISHYGIKAARLLEEVKSQWEGPLTTEHLARVIETNNKENASPQAMSDNIDQQNISFGRKQGYSDILLLLDKAFGTFDQFDYYTVNELTVEDAGNFYTGRVESVRQWLDGEAGERYTQQEKEYLIRQFEKVKVPLYYEAADGWDQLFYLSPSLITVIALVIGYLVSGIFSCEKQWKADAVFFTSFHGKKKGVRSKLWAGLAITAGTYFTSMAIFTGGVLGCIGTGGAGTMIQAQFFGCDSLYNMTVWQEYVVILLGGFLGCLFFALLAMAVSAGTGSSILAVTIPFIFILLPNFLANLAIPGLDQVFALLPDQLLQMNLVISGYHLYPVGGMVFGAVPLLFMIYGGLTLGLLPGIHMLYTRTVVR